MIRKKPTEPAGILDRPPGVPAAAPTRMRAKKNSHGSAPAETATTTCNPFKAMGGSDFHPFNNTILRETLATVWVPGGEYDGPSSRTQTVLQALRAFKPKDEIEGMLAAQAVALHFGAMECFRRSMIPEQPGEFQSKLRNAYSGASRPGIPSLCRPLIPR